MKKIFSADPELFIETVIRDFTRSSPSNRLDSFGGDPIFEKPLVGFADGNDPLFHEYRNIVHESYLLPREILGFHLVRKDPSSKIVPESVSVISFIFPVNKKTVRDNGSQKEGPSLRWNHTRWQGQAFINEFSDHLVSVLESMGVSAVAPELSPFFKIYSQSDGFVSNWSQRHTAYAAGLGTFGLNKGFITPRGIAMRVGSVVAGMKLKSSVRTYTNYLENCLFYTTGKCGKCIRRCPGGALSEKGQDTLKCFEILFEKQKSWSEGAHGPGYIGSYAGCGLCQTGVPCSTRIPVKKAPAKSGASNFHCPDK